MMEQSEFSIGPAYLSVEAVFESPDLYDNEIEAPDFWEDDGEVIIWGYRISGSQPTFYTQIDYLPANAIEYIYICQYICNRMTDLLDGCMKKVEKHNINSGQSPVDPLDLKLRLYHSCEYLSYELESGLSVKLNQLFKGGQMQQEGQKGGLAEKVSHFKEIYFSPGGDSRTLRGRMCSEKRRFSRDINQHELKTYQEYLFLQKNLNATFHQLDELVL